MCVCVEKERGREGERERERQGRKEDKQDALPDSYLLISADAGKELAIGRDVEAERLRLALGQVVEVGVRLVFVRDGFWLLMRL